jgi:uncharacterized protein DUF1566
MFNKSLIAICLAGLLVACGGSGGSNGAHDHPDDDNDSIAPVLTEISYVPSGRDTTPDYTFNSTEAGTISYGGSCNSATTAASPGDNTITFNALAYGVHEDCTIRVTDSDGNVSETLGVSSFTIISNAPKPLNDTGITLCGDYAYNDTGYAGSRDHNNKVDCLNGASPSSTATQEGFETTNGMDSVPAGQDALFGRDVTANDSSDGHAGFSFTRVCNSGAHAGEGSCPVDPVLGNGANDWGCTLDNVTGLLWEVKTDDGGLRDKDWTYTWYSTNTSNNGGSTGLADGGSCSNGTGCDTEKYVVAVNAVDLCGSFGWRLPSRSELMGIVSNDRTKPAVDTAYFPNTISDDYWTWSPYSANHNSQAWSVNFGAGSVGSYDKLFGIYLRVVNDAY